MFFKKPEISQIWKSDSGTGYSIEDDAGRKVVLWFDSGSEDFIKARVKTEPRIVVHDFESWASLTAGQQAQAELSIGARGALQNLFERR